LHKAGIKCRRTPPTYFGGSMTAHVVRSIQRTG
jgi:hypothetical protein